VDNQQTERSATGMFRVRQSARIRSHRHTVSGSTRLPASLPFGILLVVALFLGQVGIASASVGRAQAGPDPRGIAPPEVTATAVFSFDLNSGIMLYAKDPDARMQIGSTVKVATALVVMKHGNLKEEVLIEESDMVEDITKFSNMQLQAGDTLTVGTLLYGMLLPSGNDGADALARHIGSQLSGSTDSNEATGAFVAEMNAYAESMGLENTRFTNPSGLDADNSYSTAHDLAILFGALMNDETLARIVAEPAYSFYSVGPEARLYQGDSTNRLLNQNGVIGGKTGSTGDAGGCVVLARSVEGSGALVITAILGSDLAYDAEGKISTDVRWDDAGKIFDAMDSQFVWTTPGTEGTFPGLTEELGIWGVQFRDPPAMPFPAGTEEPASYQLVLGARAAVDAPSGAVHFFFGDTEVGRIPVYQIVAQAAALHDARMAA